MTLIIQDLYTRTREQQVSITERQYYLHAMLAASGSPVIIALPKTTYRMSDHKLNFWFRRE